MKQHYISGRDGMADVSDLKFEEHRLVGVQVPLPALIKKLIYIKQAGMSKLAEETDLKSVGHTPVWVQVPLPVLHQKMYSPRRLCGESGGGCIVVRI